jgi:hypothetical protein
LFGKEADATKYGQESGFRRRHAAAVRGEPDHCRVLWPAKPGHEPPGDEMSRIPARFARFTQADVARAIRAAKQAGAGAVELLPDGTIRINPAA